MIGTGVELWALVEASCTLEEAPRAVEEVDLGLDVEAPFLGMREDS